MSLKEDMREAFSNLDKLAGRIPSDEGRRLKMLLSVINTYITYLEGKVNGDDDSRC